MTTTTHTNGPDRTAYHHERSGAARCGASSASAAAWARRFVDEVPTEQAWRAGVAEGLRLAQVAIRKGV